MGDGLGLGVGVGVGAGVVIETAKTVAVSWAKVGLLLELRTTEAHGGVPDVSRGVGVTACHAPEPAFAVPLNHSKLLPPPRLQSVMVAEVNELPIETATSKYSPAEVKEGVLTGSEPY